MRGLGPKAGRQYSNAAEPAAGKVRRKAGARDAADPGSALPDIRRRTFSALGGVTAIVVIDRGSQVVLIALLARILAPNQIGVVAAAGAVAGLLSMISSFGVNSWFIQARTLSSETRAVGRGTLILLASLMVTLAEVFAPLAGQWFNNPDVAKVLRLVAPLFLLQPLTLIAEANLMRRLRARDVVVSDFMASLVGGGAVTLPLALAGFGIWAMAVGSVAHGITRCLIVCLFDGEALRIRIGPRRSLLVLRHGIGYLLNGLLNLAYADAPKWVVGRYLPASDLGLLSRAVALVGYPGSMFAAAVERVVFPAVALLQDETIRLRQGIIEAIQLIAIVGVPLTVALILLGDVTIGGVLGPTWLGAVAPFKILAVATYFRLADRLNWIILRGVGRPYRLVWLQVGSLALIAAGCAITAPMGLSAVAGVIAASAIVTYGVNTYFAMRAVEVGASAWLGALSQGGACGVLAGCVLWPLSAGLRQTNAPDLLILGLCAAISAVAAALAAYLAPKVFLGRGGISALRAFRNRLIPAKAK